MNGCFKHIVIVLLCGICICIYAQDNPAKSKYPMRTSLLINAGISDCRLPSLGLTVSRQGQFGYYANFMIGLDNIHINHDYHADEDGSLMDGENKGVIPFYSGNRAYNRFSGTVGVITRLGIPLFSYVGAGYGFRTETRELLNKQWVETATSPRHSGVVEAGFIGQLENLTLQAGYTLFIGQQNHLYHEAKIGIGYTFDK